MIKFISSKKWNTPTTNSLSITRISKLKFTSIKKTLIIMSQMYLGSAITTGKEWATNPSIYWRHMSPNSLIIICRLLAVYLLTQSLYIIVIIAGITISSLIVISILNCGMLKEYILNIKSQIALIFSSWCFRIKCNIL